MNTAREEERRRRQRLGWMGRARVVRAVYFDGVLAPQVAELNWMTTVSVSAASSAHANTLSVVVDTTARP